MRKFKRSNGLVFGLIFCFVVLSMSGCQPLRKKFIRQKKAEKKFEDNPILTPIDYAPKNSSPQERYTYQYSLFRVWYRELHEEMTERKVPSNKRQEYLLGEMIARLQEMKKWIVAEKQEGMTASINEFQNIEEQLEASSFFGNSVSMNTRIDRAEKKIRHEFHPKVMGEYFIHE